MAVPPAGTDPAAVGVLVVDGMNVIGARPDGWWRDRPGAAARLLGGLRTLADATGRRVVLVLDGGPLRGLAEGRHGGVDVRYARRRGRDTADDRVVELVEELLEEFLGAADGAPSAPGVVTVVTSDRALRGRVERLGGRVEGATTLLRRLDAAVPGGTVTAIGSPPPSRSPDP